MIYKKTETILTGPFEGQVSTIHIVVCDYCSKQEPMLAGGDGHRTPVGWCWTAVPFKDEGESVWSQGNGTKSIELHFCSDQHKREYRKAGQR